MTEEEIVRFLRGNPAFFERHADLLAEIVLISPHSRRAVSLQERQAELLREKIKAFESSLMELLRHGADNTILADHMLSWARDLLLEHDAARLPDLIATSIAQRFAVPQVAVRVWNVARPYVQDVSDDAKLFAESLPEPFCGVNSDYEVTTWLAQPEQAVSVALLPLRLDDKVIGLIVLASPDEQRFTSTMSTDFLVHIGEVASAALSRLR
jgi:uncharacterized protein YigA (DUF484 family)